MPNYTKFLKLILPHKSEKYTVDVANTNNNLIDEELEHKVDKIQGKDLSANDFTNEYKNKLDSLKNYDDSSLKKRISDLETDNTNSKKSILNIEKEQKIQNSNIEDLKKENTKLQAENERLREDLNNSTITASSSGEDITITDSVEARFKKLVVSGNSWQETSENSPSSENISPIKNCGDNGSVDVKITGRNVFNLNSDEFGTSSLVTKKDNVVTLKDMYNIPIANNNFVLKTFKPNTTYTCKAKVKVLDRINILEDNDLVKHVFMRIGKEGLVISILKDDNKANFELNKEYDVKTVFTMPEDLTGLQISGFTFGGKETEEGPDHIRKGTIEFRDFIIYEGTDDVPYEPYQEQAIVFPLEEGQVLHKGDYLADDGIHHKRKTYIFNGTEEFTYHRTANNIVGWRFTQLTDSEPLEDLMCTHFKNTTQNIYYNNKREYGMVATANKTETTFKHYIYFTQPNEEINTIDKLKAFLTEQAENGTPVKLEYDLQEEEIEPYTPEQQEAYNKIKNAKTYKGITRIYSEDEISPIFEVEAFSNAQVEHDKLQKQIDEIKALLSSTETSAMLVDNLEKDVKKEVEEIC